MAFIIRFTTLILTGFQSHSLADSLSKRLYSAEKQKKEITTDENFGLLAYHDSG